MAEPDLAALEFPFCCLATGSDQLPAQPRPPTRTLSLPVQLGQSWSRVQPLGGSGQRHVSEGTRGATPSPRGPSLAGAGEPPAVLSGLSCASLLPQIGGHYLTTIANFHKVLNCSGIL